MNNLINKIKDTYLERCSSSTLQKKIWEDLALFFKPDIKNYRLNRPSSLVAGETGDLGLAVLWIVQTALTRPVINDLVLSATDESTFISLAGNITDSSLCALAHSEDSSSPVLLTEEDDSIILNGVKKFITAGVNADYILLTCRDKNEPKINRAVMLNRELIDPDEMKDLNLPVMKSVNHTSLNFINKKVAHKNVPPVDAPSLRRSIKKWSLIERAMIIEAFIPFLRYFNKAAAEKGIIIIEDDILHNLTSLQSSLVCRQLDEAFYTGKITSENINIKELLDIISRFREKSDEISHILDEADKLKFNDVFLFDSLK